MSQPHPVDIADKPWLAGSFALLHDTHAQGRLAHALLLMGPTGCGKLALARAIAAMLLCVASPKPCGKCRGCALVTGGTHPDLHTLAPPEGSQHISIDQIRALIEKLGIKSHQGGYSAVVCGELGQVRGAAAHSLLKLLEEPPANTVCICCTADPGLLLPTIRSRLQVHQVLPPTRAAGFDYLQQHGVDRDQAQVLLHLARGAPLRALAMQQQQYIEHRNQVINLFQMCYDRLLGSMFTVVRNLGNFPLAATLELISSCMVDVMVLHQCGTDQQTRIHNRDKRQQLIQWAAQLDIHNAYAGWDQLLQLTDACNRGIALNTQTQLFNLAIHLVKMLHQSDRRAAA